MLDNARDGLFGLILFISNWLSPGGERPELLVSSVSMQDRAYYIQAGMEIAWNKQLGELVDAGIPLRFKISAFPDEGDTISFVRSLMFDIAEYTYTFADTLVQPVEDSTHTSKSYPQVLLALRDFCRWHFKLDESASACRLEAELLPSRAEQLNRSVDMTPIWGQRKIYKVISLQ
ncbi:MAG: hypothetical protein GF398_12120 [Chitinivibrionales bacterium]|nr:hypothetical protein [Chitinivibrionales bacterium]